MPQLSPMMGILFFTVILVFLFVMVTSMKTNVPVAASKSNQKAPSQKFRFFYTSWQN